MVASSFKQYRDIYSGPIMLGLEVGQQAWGGALLSDQDVADALNVVNNDGVAGNGIFVWAYQKEATGTPSVEYIISKAAQTAQPKARVQAVANDSKEWKVKVTCPACQYNIKVDYF